MYNEYILRHVDAIVFAAADYYAAAASHSARMLYADDGLD